MMNEPTKELQTIPGVGKSIACDLADVGIRHVRDLKGRDPERLYHKLNVLRGRHIDRSVRCAVYFASAEKHDPALLKWWNWSDKKIGADGRPAPRRLNVPPARRGDEAPRQGRFRHA
jgi:nucleotidyltransferase/DNA polymerase involved in DNA repair